MAVELTCQQRELVTIELDDRKGAKLVQCYACSSSSHAALYDHRQEKEERKRGGHRMEHTCRVDVTCIVGANTSKLLHALNQLELWSFSSKERLLTVIYVDQYYGFVFVISEFNI